MRAGPSRWDQPKSPQLDLNHERQRTQSLPESPLRSPFTLSSLLVPARIFLPLFQLRHRFEARMLCAMPKASSALILVAALVLGGCAFSEHEPANLALHKQELRHYVDSGDYGREMARIAAQATVWIERRALRRTPGHQLTVVFDVDDTLLSGWPYIVENDFGWTESTWQAWIDAANAPVIEPVREVYRKARRLGVDVIFLTARSEHDRKATEKNLHAVECGDYAVLICKPNGLKTMAATFKTAERKRLVGEGRVIIAMIGDQESDLAGGFAERMFKLPNPFYLTP
jgi:hypothetical protein